MPNIQEVGHSSFLIDARNVIDAGNILRTLGEKSIALETVWVTHSHLDHIVDLAFIIDEYFDTRTKTLKIMALKETIDALKAHVFNNVIWPDFSKIPLPHGEGMALSYEEIDLNKTYTLENEKKIKAFTGDHTVASVGYKVSSGNSAILLSSDTYSLEEVVTLVHEDEQISTLVIECSFPVRMAELAKSSKHLTPELLFNGLKTLENKGLKLYINHIKAMYQEEIIKEIEVYKKEWDVMILKEGVTLEF
ncbi:MAG: 3',5'-cyclic-nucleotide phosphodiesterase [Sulfurovum sp.]|nr:3',5'-cyclic-nucleotide phosphodiesterase [Sulfurovum sp.]